MYFNLGVALIVASVVSAQTSTECNPLKTTCSPNPAIGKAGVSCDFVAHGACDAFNNMNSIGFIYDSRGGVAQMTAPGQWPTLRSNEYIFYGRVDVVVQAAAGAGIVTAMVLQSDDLDEIDFEWVGAKDTEVQSNYFSKGDDSVFDRGGFHPVDRPLSTVHTYSFSWTRESIEWLVDDVVVRTLRRADVAADKFPQSPAQIKLGAWVAGFEGQRPGTTAWAGGKADFSSGPKTAIYKSVRIVDYAGGSSATDKDVKEYVYGDRSGSDESIQIVPGDDSSTTADKLQDSLPSSPESSSLHSDAVKKISTAPALTTIADSSSETAMASSSTLNMATNTTANATSSSLTKATPAAKMSNKSSEVTKIPESSASTAGVAAGVVALAVGALAHLSCLV